MSRGNGKNSLLAIAQHHGRVILQVSFAHVLLFHVYALAKKFHALTHDHAQVIYAAR